MAKDSNELGISLLTKCYPYGSLPPEVDHEGNIEYKVNKKGSQCQRVLFYLSWIEIAQINKPSTWTTRTLDYSNEMEVITKN